MVTNCGLFTPYLLLLTNKLILFAPLWTVFFLSGGSVSVLYVFGEKYPVRVAAGKEDVFCVKILEREIRIL